ncbi:MAG: adenylate kinase family protein [Candidatus Aenigmarchaeota archaeon]|nr:adenylate kinase family protein [Candidatus Aenigmarchaeota archaeon]
MIIAITGTPGTGKTTVAKLLAKKLGWRYVSVNDIVFEKKLYLGFDEKRKSYDVDMKALNKEIEALRKTGENIILDGHLSHLLKVDKVIVLRCRPDVLKKRLEKKYDWYTKIYENIEAERFGVILEEALKSNREVYEIDTTDKEVKEVVEACVNIVEGRGDEFKPGRISWI